MAKKYEDWVTDDIKKMIPKWKRQGQKDDWIAKKIGVGKNKIIEWKKEQKEFRELFINGTTELLLELEETLYTRAKGHMVLEKEVTKDNQGRETIKTKEKYIWSDPCLVMALKKLDPDKWGDTYMQVREDAIKVDTKIKIDNHTGAGKGKNKLAEAVQKNFEKRKGELNE